MGKPQLISSRIAGLHGRSDELGIVETGFAYGMNLADSEWFDSRMIAEIRWIR